MPRPLTPGNSCGRQRSLSRTRPIGCAAAGPSEGAGRPLPEKLLAGYQPEFACFRSRVLAFLSSFHPRRCPPHPAPCWPTQCWRAQVCSPGFAPTFTLRKPSGPQRNQRRSDVTAAWWRSGGSDSLLLEGNIGACAAEGRLPRWLIRVPGWGRGRGRCRGELPKWKALASTQN